MQLYLQQKKMDRKRHAAGKESRKAASLLWNKWIGCAIIDSIVVHF